MKKLLAFLSLIFIVSFVYSQPIPRSTPSAEGVAASAIQQFIETFDKNKHELHSVMILRHGKVIAESWWAPYTPATKQLMYSVSKSWNSTAIGLLADEKRLSVDAKVINFFPEYKDLADKPFMQEMRVKDLLTMSCGQEKEESMRVFGSRLWSRAFMEVPLTHTPGTHFAYNTTGSYMLSAILQRVTGKTEMEYLKTRLFEPLGISGVDWETNLEGINLGGSGFRDHTEDMAKLGLLYLNKGVYNGKRILSEDWIRQATSKQIDQNPDARPGQRDSSDWVQGYGYQFWRCRHNAFRADGAFGQYIVVMPDQDAVVVITSESQDLQDDLNQVWTYLLPAFENKTLPADPAADEKLKTFLETRHLDAPVSSVKKGDKKIFNQPVTLTENEFGFTSLELKGKNKKFSLVLKTKDGQTHAVVPGFQQWKQGETQLAGPNLFRRAPVNFAALAPFKIFSSYRWIDEKTIEITERYIESPHKMVYTIHQTDMGLQVMLVVSSNAGTILNLTAVK